MPLIYFDNAATSRTKPGAVYDAFAYYLHEVGTSPGRGTYSLGIQASRMLYQTRNTVANYFGLPDSSRVFFTKSSTEAVNLFTNGSLSTADHVLLSCFEHNAVLRPIHHLSQTKGVNYSIIADNDLYSDDLSCLDKYITSSTKVAFFTLASNLTGQYVYRKELGEYLHAKGIMVFVDASQGAGKTKINMAHDSIDYLAFTGHKDLYGLPGTGGLCCINEFSVVPLIQGGTGIYGDNFVNPDVYPEAYEAGTLNMPAIWALKAAIEYTRDNYEKHHSIEQQLMGQLIDGLMDIPKVTVFNPNVNRVSTICFNVDDVRSDEVVKLLDVEDICVRGGIHCAILAHKTLGTVETGAIRASLDYNNTYAEIQQFLCCIKKMG